MFRFAIALTMALPTAVFAVGSDDPETPKPTETTTECTDGQIWDDKTQTCVDAQDSRLDDDTRYRAVREFAYAGQPYNALNALRHMDDQSEDRVLTYLGFINRQIGQTELAMDYYGRALAANPDNLLARSYLGQAHVLDGNLQLAEAQLAEIYARGGVGGWPATALAEAISSGEVVTY